MIMSTVSHLPHTREGAETLAGMGYDYVALRISRQKFTEMPEWQEAVATLR